MASGSDEKTAKQTKTSTKGGTGYEQKWPPVTGTVENKGDKAIIDVKSGAPGRGLEYTGDTYRDAPLAQSHIRRNLLICCATHAIQ
jgi:hypothetical protein